MCVDTSTCRLADNPVCQNATNKQSDYCTQIKGSITFSIPQITCPQCDQESEPTPSCRCVYPIIGTFTFRSPSFSGFSNDSKFKELQERITVFFVAPNDLVESVAIRNIRETETDYHLLVDLLIFPSGKEIRFNQTGMEMTLSGFSSQSFKPPDRFGPYVFVANPYKQFSGMIKLVTHT